MRKSKIVSKSQTSIELPKCPNCGEEMWLARIEPSEPGYESCIFECPSCDSRIVKIGEYRKPAGWSRL